MFAKKRGSGQSIIWHGDVVEGIVRIGGALRVDGEVRGRVEAEGPVAIGKDGLVVGEVHAEELEVAGRIEGKAIARRNLHMLATGVVKGDAFFETLEVDKGGVIHGHTASAAEDTPAAVVGGQDEPGDDSVEAGPALANS